jgi:hypothetical protein
MRRAQQLAQRREVLLADCRRQRAALKEQVVHFQFASGWMAEVKKISLWSVGVVGAIFLLRPTLKSERNALFTSGRVTFLLRNGVAIWQLLRSLAPLFNAKPPRT